MALPRWVSFQAAAHPRMGLYSSPFLLEKDSRELQACAIVRKRQRDGQNGKKATGGGSVTGRVRRLRSRHARHVSCFPFLPCAVARPPAARLLPLIASPCKCPRNDPTFLMSFIMCFHEGRTNRKVIFVVAALTIKPSRSLGRIRAVC